MKKIITGTDASDQIWGTENDDRINGGGDRRLSMIVVKGFLDRIYLIFRCES